MPRERYTNAQPTTLNGTINDSVTSLVVTDGSSFPTAYFRILVENEIMFCTSRSSNTLTVVRGQEGTTAVSHNSGVAVNHVMTAGLLDQFRKDCLADLGFVDSSDSLSADDDDFDDENFSGWTTVFPATPSCTLTERDHTLSMDCPNGGGNGVLFAIVKAKTPSAGDWVQTGFNFGMYSGHALPGLILADGTTHGAGKQIVFWWSIAESRMFLSTWQNYTSYTGSGVYTAGTQTPTIMQIIHLRLECVATNQYKIYVSPDAISWAQVGGTHSLGTLGTPSYMGLVAQWGGSTVAKIASFKYARFSF